MKKLVLIVMGSLGSSKVNEYLFKELQKCDGKDYEVLFITGNNTYESVIKHKFPSNVKIIAFSDELGGLMKKTDLMISRAGASTLSEIMALEVPSILIPSPYVANNHQYYNALSLSSKKAAILLEEKDLQDGVLSAKIDEVINDNEKLMIMKKNLAEFKVNDSATIIYNNLKKLMK